tara:strand:+ start:1127 stop:1777 length:651 start_codon:yes stop_codon:yes gene_type:complete
MKHHEISYIKVVLLVILTLFSSLAGAVEHTGEVWNTNKISVPLMEDHLGLSIEEEIRIRHTDGFYYSHSDVGFSNSSLKSVGFSLNYRVVFDVNDSGWFVEHRPHFNISHKYKGKRVSVSNRTRFEIRFYENKKTKVRYRHKLKISIKMADLSIYVSDEIFLAHSENPVPRNRNSIGMTYSPSKAVKLGLSYLLQQDFKDVLILNHVAYFKMAAKF